MKLIKVLFIVLVLIIPGINANAEALALEHGLLYATPGALRLHIADIYAGYDQWTYEGNSDKYEYARAIQNMGVTYTLGKSLELSARMQYMYWLQRVNATQTAATSGFGQAYADIKYFLGGFITLGARYYYQASRPELELGSGGSDIKAFAVLEGKSTYMSVGYVLTGAYALNEVNYNPGEVVTGGIGFRFGGENLKFLLEFRVTNFYTMNKVDGVEIDDTTGFTLDMFPGIRLDMGPFRLKAGVGIAIGGNNLLGIDMIDFPTENLRGPGTNPVKYREVSYDITPVLGISYKFGGTDNEIY